MASKYDTNPLDPDFPKKAAQQAAQAGAQQTRNLSYVEEETRAFSGAPTAEDPTRRYNNGYSNGNNGSNGNFDQAAYNHYAYAQPQAQPPATYQTAHLPQADKPSNRKVGSVGLPENVMMVLPYTPFYIGLVASILELLFVPQSETKVRFHAAQGLALHIAILLITFLLGFIANFASGARFGNFIFGFVAMVGLIITMVRVWKGKAVHFEFLDNLTTWLSEKVTMQKK